MLYLISASNALPTTFLGALSNLPGLVLLILCALSSKLVSENLHFSSKLLTKHLLFSSMVVIENLLFSNLLVCVVYKDFNMFK